MTEIDSATLARLTFRRQFVLGQDFVKRFPLWSRVKIDKSMYLTVHPDLEVRHVAKKNKSITLLGYILNPFDPAASNLEIVGELLDKLETCDGFFEYTACFGGRWILIVNDSVRTVIFTDAAGLRQVYYTIGATADQIWCASQPGLLAELLDLPKSDEALAFVRNYKKNEEQTWYPGDTTLYEAIKLLLPNHYLDLGTRRVHRYWPSAELPVLSIEAATSKSLEILRGLMESARLRFNLAVSMTAGWDSRLVLAATQPMAKDVYYFTQLFWNMHEDDLDVTTPSRLLQNLGLKHNVITCRSEVNAEFYSIYRRNVIMGHEFYGPFAQGLFDRIPKDRINVWGDVAEIAKCYYRPSGSSSASIAAESLAALTRMPADRFVIRAFQQWLSGAVPHLYNVHLLDLFFWEQEAGSLQATIQAQCDIALEAFSPFNCRMLLTTLLSVPERHRRPPTFDLFRVIIGHLWRDVLNEPINGAEQIGLIGALRWLLDKTGVTPLIPAPIKRLRKELRSR